MLQFYLSALAPEPGCGVSAGGSLEATAQLSLLVESLCHCSCSWTFFWGGQKATWLLPHISKATFCGWVSSAPKAAAKHPERALPHPDSAQWDLLQKWQSIRCNGSSCGVNRRNILLNTIVIGNSEGINLGMVLLMSVSSGVSQWLRAARCRGLILVWRCRHGKVNPSAEGLFTVIWVVRALLHCLSPHAPASFPRRNMPH